MATLLPGHSTSDVMLTLYLLLNLHCEFTRPLYVPDVGSKSVFDSIDCEAVWKSLCGIGVSTMIFNLIKDLYSCPHSKVQLGTIL